MFKDLLELVKEGEERTRIMKLAKKFSVNAI